MVTRRRRAGAGRVARLHLLRAETFSDLRTVAAERFAAGITVPVLLVHGAMDVDTRPDHSQRVFAALKRPKRLILVPNAGHNGSLRQEVWEEIDRWIDQVIPRAT